MKLDYRTRVDPVVICECGFEPDFNMITQENGEIVVTFACPNCTHYFQYKGMKAGQLKLVNRADYGK